MVTEGRAPPWDPETQRPDVAVLVGLPRELRELCAVAGQGYPWPNATYGGDDYLLLAPNDRGRAYRVVVFFMGDESGNAAVQAGNRLLALQPALVVSLGVACSLDAKALRIRLVGALFLDELLMAHEAYGEALGITKPTAPTTPAVTIVEPLRALSDAIAAYVIQVLAFAGLDRAKNTAPARHALEPIDRLRRAAARRNAGSNATPSDPTETDTDTTNTDTTDPDDIEMPEGFPAPDAELPTLPTT